jgi:hypothetical protein
LGGAERGLSRFLGGEISGGSLQGVRFESIIGEWAAMEAGKDDFRFLSAGRR